MTYSKFVSTNHQVIIFVHKKLMVQLLIRTSTCTLLIVTHQARSTSGVREREAITACPKGAPLPAGVNYP